MFIRLHSMPPFRATAQVAVWVFCGVALAPASHGGADASKPASLDAADISGRLDALNPRFKAPPAGVFSVREESPIPLALLGIDLTQEGASLDAEPPTFSGLKPLTLTAYWIPRAPVRRAIDIEVRVMAANPLLVRSLRFTAGPTDVPEWNAGNVYRQQYSIDLSKIATAFTGKGSLTVGISRRTGANPLFFPLQTVPVFLAPRADKSTVAADSLKNAFGAHLKDLAVDFILGSDARQSVAIDTPARDGLVSLGVVSAFGYGGLSQGTPVCEVIFTDENNRSARAEILCGIDTARADYDFLPADKATHKKAPVVESSDAVDFNAEGRPFRRHKYAGVIPIPAGLGRIVSVEFHALTDRIFEIYDVALVYGEGRK